MENAGFDSHHPVLPNLSPSGSRRCHRVLARIIAGRLTQFKTGPAPMARTETETEHSKNWSGRYGIVPSGYLINKGLPK